ncbi:DUF927 domain-containing protein [Acetobacter indonesiensis]|uniref:DUF927 domain-containing protein n=1 Tax=Acetobacter indonesiensis TaxID=104101 RepID=UPI001F487352|nr:DUF927 domain-containing protein [Acetobacter indonesiensis]MCG0994860.1 DUF927 domain-containing protein [Acetobacter indonesiensis]
MTDSKGQNGRNTVRAGLTSAKVVPMPGTQGKKKSSSQRIESPCGRFFCDAHGLFRKAADSNKTDMKLSGPIWIVAETRGADGKGWGILLAWTDRDGQQHEQAFPRAMFAGDCAELRSQLADGGLTLQSGPAAKAAFADWLSSISSTDRALSVNRIGWHTLSGGMVYVLPDTTYGNLKERVVLQTTEQEPNLFGVSGTVEDWKQHIGQFCKGNSRLVMAVCTGFAAPLLGVLGLEGGGVSFVGPSRAGKSTALLLACSVCGGTPESGAKGYARSWRSTSNGMESVALSSCDALLPMDEVGQLDPKEIGDVAYMLANGQGKVRASRTGGARATARWRSLFLSTGENTLDDMNKLAGRPTKAGQEVRFCDVPADAGHNMGMFENIHHCDSPGEFSDYLGNACGQYYGAPLRAFLDTLTQRMEAEGIRIFRESLLARMEAISTIYLSHWPNASGQVRSVSRRFAMIALAGELATEFGLTGWDHDTPDVLVSMCFGDWLRARGTAGRREDEQAIQQLRDFITQNLSARLEPWIDKDADEMPVEWGEGKPPPERYRTQKQAGWRRWAKGPDGRYIWCPILNPAGMREALTGLNQIEAKKILVERGLLIPGKGGKNSDLMAPPGYAKNTRVYVISAHIFSVATGDK